MQETNRAEREPRHGQRTRTQFEEHALARCLLEARGVLDWDRAVLILCCASGEQHAADVARLVRALLTAGLPQRKLYHDRTGGYLQPFTAAALREADVVVVVGSPALRNVAQTDPRDPNHAVAALLDRILGPLSSPPSPSRPRSDSDPSGRAERTILPVWFSGKFGDNFSKRLRPYPRRSLSRRSKLFGLICDINGLNPLDNPVFDLRDRFRRLRDDKDAFAAYTLRSADDNEADVEPCQQFSIADH